MSHRYGRGSKRTLSDFNFGKHKTARPKKKRPKKRPKNP